MRVTICQEVRNYRDMQTIKQADRLLLGKSDCPSYWIARIKHFHPKYVFDREFIKPVVDYSKANSKLSRGVYYYWHLEPGLYDSCLGDNYDRSFLIVEDGNYKFCSKNEAVAWLSKSLESTC